MIKTPKRATMTELETIANLSDVRIRKHIAKSGLKKGKDGKYNTKAVINAILSHREAANNQPKEGDSNPFRQIRATKIALECKILQEKLGILRGETISLEEHDSEVAEIAEMVNGGLEQWVQWVAAIKRDLEMLKKAKEIRDNVRRYLAGKVGE